VRQSWGRAGPPRCAPSWARGARARQSKRERRPGAAGASAASSAIRCYPLRGAPIMGSGGSRKYQGGCVRSETMRSGLALAGQESNSGLVRIGMEDRGGVLVGFRHSQKRVSGGGASWKTGFGAGSREEDGRDRGGVAVPYPAPPSSSPTAPSSSITKFAPDFNLLSLPSPDLRPRGQRRGSRGTRRATQRTSPHRPSHHPLSLSLFLSRGRA
jgi:hypothetical protein